MLGTSDTCWKSHLSQRTKEQAYYIADCLLLNTVWIVMHFISFCGQNTYWECADKFNCIIVLSQLKIALPFIGFLFQFVLQAVY